MISYQRKPISQETQLEERCKMSSEGGKYERALSVSPWNGDKLMVVRDGGSRDNCLSFK